VLKHETSTLRQSHNFISIDLKRGVSDYVREITSPAKFGSDPMSGRDATSEKIHRRDLNLWHTNPEGSTLSTQPLSHRGATYTGTVTFFSLVFVFLFFNRATAHTREPIFAHNSSKDAAWCKEDPVEDKNV